MCSSSCSIIFVHKVFHEESSTGHTKYANFSPKIELSSDLVLHGVHPINSSYQKISITKAYPEGMVVHRFVSVYRTVVEVLLSTTPKIATIACRPLAVYNNRVTTCASFLRISTSTTSSTSCPVVVFLPAYNDIRSLSGEPSCSHADHKWKTLNPNT